MKTIIDSNAIRSLIGVFLTQLIALIVLSTVDDLTWPIIATTLIVPVLWAVIRVFGLGTTSDSGKLL